MVEVVDTIVLVSDNKMYRTRDCISYTDISSDVGGSKKIACGEANSKRYLYTEKGYISEDGITWTKISNFNSVINSTEYGKTEADAIGYYSHTGYPIFGVYNSSKYWKFFAWKPDTGCYLIGQVGSAGVASGIQYVYWINDAPVVVNSIDTFYPNSGTMAHKSRLSNGQTLQSLYLRSIVSYKGCQVYAGYDGPAEQTKIYCTDTDNGAYKTPTLFFSSTTRKSNTFSGDNACPMGVRIMRNYENRLIAAVIDTARNAPVEQSAIRYISDDNYGNVFNYTEGDAEINSCISTGYSKIVANDNTKNIFLINTFLNNTGSISKGTVVLNIQYSRIVEWETVNFPVTLPFEGKEITSIAII